jgi:DNA-binding transcriptional LysR family regulator
MDLLAVADFTLVARHGGFGKAARAALRPKATLSRRVAELEASLNLRLFERGGRDLKLTEEGRTLFERAGALLTELEETATAIASGGARVAGRLRISAPLLFSQTAMGRLAADFTRRHPDARLEVTTGDQVLASRQRGVIAAIEMARTMNSSHFQSAAAIPGPVSISPIKCTWSTNVLFRADQPDKGTLMNLEFVDGLLVRATGKTVFIAEGNVR